ncbi:MULTISPECIES: hypothetical protein [Streptomyces]|uniref:hypothetical protein n=1 Tax=Streptomyces lycopersici TaxID=2974589 RepID=UPI0021D1EB10|nr:hypothetical protein [Streptomyces sp. NEAU-383]
MTSSSTSPGEDVNSRNGTTAPNTADTAGGYSSSGAGPDEAADEPRRKIRYGIASALALTGVGQLLSANIFVTDGWWRMLLTVGAVCTAVGVVQLLPQTWHNRMSTVAVTFATVAGIVPLFLVEPEDNSPKADPVALAAYVERGPFDQELPKPLHPEGLALANAGLDSGSTKLTAVQVKIGIDPKIGVFIPGDNGEETFHIYAYLEIYPKDDEATKRADSEKKKLAIWDTPLERDQDNGNYCFQGVGTKAAYWECRGARGSAFASVTLTPGDNADLGKARDTITALLNYADSMARKATPAK